MEHPSSSKTFTTPGNDDDDDDDGAIDPNPVGLLQKRHSQPLHSHETYLVPEIQPHSPSAARGCNPWTGQTADEIREAAYSEYQFQQLIKTTKKRDNKASVQADNNKKVPTPAAPMSPQTKEGTTSKEHLEELDELMFDTAM